MLKTNKKDLLNSIEKCTKSNLDVNKFYISSDEKQVVLSGLHISRNYQYQIDMFIENSGDPMECYEIELDSKLKTILKKFSGLINISIDDNKIMFADSKNQSKKYVKKQIKLILLKSQEMQITIKLILYSLMNY